MPENNYLYLTVFLTGAAVLILEVAAVRILTPHFGSSLYVFSSVLTVILAALSVGYWYGGRRADKEQSIDTLYRIIAISGILVLALLLVAQLIIPLIAALLSVQTGPLLLSTLLFFAPAFLLGIVSPYIIKLQSLITPAEHIGEVVGKTFFFGTFGSITGSLLTGFWLIPLLGVQQTIILVNIILLGTGIVIPLFLGRPCRLTFVVTLAVSSFVLLLLLHAIAIIEAKPYVYYGQGQYSTIRIIDLELNNQPVRFLWRDMNNSSAVYKNSDDLVFSYAQFATLYPDLVPGADSFLLLGGGAYTIPRTLLKRDPRLTIDVVEIEPKLMALSQAYFGLVPSPRLKNHTMDARRFLLQTDQTFDVIFADTFDTNLAAPFHLTTAEFYTLLRSRLHDDGVLILNVVGTPKGIQPSLFGSVHKTIASVFSNYAIYTLMPDDYTKQQNIMIIARNGSTPIALPDAHITDPQGAAVAVADLLFDTTRPDFRDEILLTDDHAPIEYLVTRQE